MESSDARSGLAHSFEIIAEHRTPIATAQIARYRSPDLFDQHLSMPGSYRVDMSVTPRPPNARAGYDAHWGPHRFEPLGAVYALPPGERLHFRSDAGSTTSVVCDLQPQALTRWLDEDFRWTTGALEATLNLSSPRVRALLQQLGEELRAPGLAHAAMVELIAAQLALELARCTEASGARNPMRGGLSQRRLRLIDERLDAPGTGPTIAELAAECGLSIRQLMRGFQASRGVSLGAYIREHRFERAKRLLACDVNIKQVAIELGFASASSFSYAFRRSTGCTPRRFRTDWLRLRC